MTQELPEQVKRWSAKRRQAVVLQLLRGETTVVEAAREHGLTVREVEEWRNDALAGMENSLCSRPHNEVDQKEHEMAPCARFASKQLKQKIGDLVMDIEIYKEAMRGHPFGRKTLNELEK